MFARPAYRSRGVPAGGRALDTEPLAGDGSVVKRDDGICEDLVGMTTFAGDQHHVTGTGVSQCGLDGDPSVGLDAELCPAVETRPASRRESG